MFTRLFGKKTRATANGAAGSEPDQHEEPSIFHPANDDRTAFYETPEADALARKLLSEARSKHALEPVGFRTMIEIPEGYVHVHNMELMLAFMNIDMHYGFQAGAMFNNTIDLVKI